MTSGAVAWTRRRNLRGIQSVGQVSSLRPLVTPFSVTPFSATPITVFTTSAQAVRLSLLWA